MANPKTDKIWGDAIRRAVHRETEITDEDGTKKKVQYITILASKLVSKAAEGDAMALREIGDRLDGKAPQAIEGNMNLTITLASDDAKFG